HNKQIVFLSGGVPLQYAFSLQQKLVAPLGWHLTYDQTAGTPAAYAQGFTQAISQHPAAIELAGLPDATVVPQITQARAAGIKLVSTAGPQLVKPGFDSYLSVRADLLFRVAADKVIADSGATAHALFLVPSGYAEFDMNIPMFVKEMAACAPKCKATVRQI